MKILIVEDEKDILNALQKGLKKRGYAVDTACDGEEALESYYSNFYDVIVLDLNLPKLDGIDVLKEIRFENKEVNVIILSARSEVEDKIIGLDSGANDYLAKPFHFAELEARIRALLRRNYKVIDTVIQIDNLKLDTASKKVFVDLDEIKLTKKEYSILEYLLINKEKVISAEELIEHIWESDTDSFSNSFKVHINSLRKKLPENFIKNLRGQGYYV